QTGPSRSCARSRRKRRSPLQVEGGFARNAVGKADDLGRHLEAQRAQLLLVEDEGPLGVALERLRPFGVEVVDAAAAVVAVLDGEGHNLNLMQALLCRDAH